MFEAPRPARTAAIGTADVAIGLPPGDGIDYQRILSVLWRGKTTILATVAVSLLIAVLFVVLVPHRYTAVTQILIDPTDLRAVSNDLSPPNQASDASVLQVESQVRVLMSDSVLRRVVKTEGLENDPEFVGSCRQQVSPKHGFWSAPTRIGSAAEAERDSRSTSSAWRRAIAAR